MDQRLISRFIAAWFACFVISLSARAERLPIKAYTSADGLGSSFISCMLQDSRGFLWVCTRDGLSRFDGSQFVTYQVGDGSAPGVEQMVETGNGIYWIMTNGGLYRFDPSSPAVSAAKSGERVNLPVRYVDSSRGYLFADRDGNLWTGNDGLYRRYEDGQTIATERIELNLPRNPRSDFAISEMMQSRHGSLWLYTNWGLVRPYRDGREVFYSMDDAQVNPITSVVEDADGLIWVGRMLGLYIINPETPVENPAKSVTVVNLDQRERIVKPSLTYIELPTTVGEIVKYDMGNGFLPELVTAVYQTA